MKKTPETPRTPYKKMLHTPSLILSCTDQYPHNSSLDGTSSCGPTGPPFRRLLLECPARCCSRKTLREAEGGEDEEVTEPFLSVGIGGTGGTGGTSLSIFVPYSSSLSNGGMEDAENPCSPGVVTLVCLELKVAVEGVDEYVRVDSLCELYRRMTAVGESGGDLTCIEDC